MIVELLESLAAVNSTLPEVHFRLVGSRPSVVDSSQFDNPIGCVPDTRPAPLQTIGKRMVGGE